LQCKIPRTTFASGRNDGYVGRSPVFSGKHDNSVLGAGKTGQHILEAPAGIAALGRHFDFLIKKRA